MNDLLLSIVVIGRNEGARLAHCLESVARMRGIEGTKEIIYVDSASTDGSPQEASALGAEVIVLDNENLSAARARNAGWNVARAPYILFLDGDTILNSDFPRTALSALMLDDRIAAVWGHRREIHPEDSIYNRMMDLDWIYPPGETEYCGGDVMMRRRALEKVEGYDSTLIAGEEPELCRRLRAQGYCILHIDVPMTRHDLNIVRIRQYWERAMRAGYAYADVSDRFRTSTDPMWVRESYSNLLRGGFLLASLAASVASLRFSRAPFVGWLVLFAVLSARSAWRARWKAREKPVLLLCYGLHSQLQQIPILFGQLRYYLDRKSSRRSRLIEYKETN